MEMDQGRVVYGRGPTTEEEEQVERIRRRAHEIWEEEGRPEGYHEEHWRRAEQDILSGHQK